MPSRMDRYYNNNNELKKRSSKNQELYKRIYDEGEYSNIEGIANLTKSNEVDITKIKDMIQNRENYRNQKRYHEILNKEEEIILEPKMDDLEEKSYDIRDVLNKAKSEQGLKPGYHRLKESELPNPDRIRKLKIEEEPEDEKLKGLINTITNTSMLNKMNDKELSLDLLDDLKSNGTTVVKKINNNNDDIDTSFYTAGMKFKEKDFEELQDMNTNIKKNNKLIKILIICIFIIVFIAIGLLVYNLVIK